MSKKKRRNRHKDFQGVRSEKGKPRKDRIRAKMRDDNVIFVDFVRKERIK